jgi:hypothetical protein
MKGIHFTDGSMETKINVESTNQPSAGKGAGPIKTPVIASSPEHAADTKHPSGSLPSGKGDIKFAG